MIQDIVRVMYKIKIPLDNLRINKAKVNKSNLNKVLDNILLKSYKYIDYVNVLYKTTKRNRRPYTTRSLEIFCTTKLTQKSVKKLIKRLHKNGLHIVENKSDTKVTFVEVEKNQVEFGVHFVSLKSIKIVEHVHFKNRSTYLTHHMYSK